MCRRIEGSRTNVTLLPQPPDFPALAPPDYADGKPVATREAYGLAFKRLGAVNPHIVAMSCGREEFHVF